MGRIAGIKKDRVTISISHGNAKRIDEAIAKGEFSNVSEAINEAITIYFLNTGKTTITKEWLMSEEGREYIKLLMRRAHGE
jgi:metal-responsive CopG/Arc/MetJ family transcriptional regulator